MYCQWRLLGIENLCGGVILLPISQGALDFVQHVSSFGTVHVCTFDIPQAHLAFRHT